MNYDNRLKAKITQSLFECLLEDANYRVVPLGIEELIREIKGLDSSEYLKLGLPLTLKKLPDFFVAHSKLERSFLVEVKFRRCWSEATKKHLGRDLIDQVRLWGPLHLVLFLGEPAKRESNLPSSFLRVCKLDVRADQLVVVQRQQLLELEGTPQSGDQVVPWAEMTWAGLSRFQDVFNKVSDRWQDSTIEKAIKLVNLLNDLGRERNAA